MPWEWRIILDVRVPVEPETETPTDWKAAWWLGGFLYVRTWCVYRKENASWVIRKQKVALPTASWPRKRLCGSTVPHLHQSADQYRGCLTLKPQPQGKGGSKMAKFNYWKKCYCSKWEWAILDVIFTFNFWFEFGFKNLEITISSETKFARASAIPTGFIRI